MRHTKSSDERLLVRYVAGELAEDARRLLEARLAAEPDLRDALEELERAWSALDRSALDRSAEGAADAERGPRPELRAEVLAEIRHHEDGGDGELRWSAAPLWVKAGSAASLAVGIALGLLAVQPESSPVDEASAPVWLEAPEPTLADAYWRALEDVDGRLEEDL